VISGIILAAGRSTRMGEPKQLLSYLGRPLLQHLLDRAAAEEALDEILLVVGHRAGEILEALVLPPRCRPVLNPEYLIGQSTSLRAGLEAADPNSEAAVVLLGDEPLLPAGAVAALVERFRSTGEPALRVLYRGPGQGPHARPHSGEGAEVGGGVPGHPVLLARSLWEGLSALTGDVGARGLLQDGRSIGLTLVPFPAPAPPELDTPEDYGALLAGG